MPKILVHLSLFISSSSVFSLRTVPESRNVQFLLVESVNKKNAYQLYFLYFFPRIFIFLISLKLL